MDASSYSKISISASSSQSEYDSDFESSSGRYSDSESGMIFGGMLRLSAGVGGAAGVLG